MAQSIKADHLADHLVDEERRRLIDENSRLLGELRERYDFSGLIGTTGVVEGRRLPPTLQTARSTGTMPGQSFADAVEAFERDLLLDALKTTRGNRAKAARLLGTTPRILNYKVRKYQINHRVPSVWRPESVRK
jgi:transcriptional regulator with GAF, ATPase, and Fis domain